MLKAEFHTHINADPEDKYFVKYSAFELIDNAAELNFQVLGISCHNLVYENKEAEKYAQEKRITLLFGMEKTLQGKHVLIYNITNEEAEKIRTFEELIELKKEKPELLVIAPHPFHFHLTCLKKKIIKYLELFDAWEYNYFYLKSFNPNKRTVRLARRYDKCLVGGSDVHVLKDLGKTYTLIESVNSKEKIFQAVKEGKVRIVSKPCSNWEMFSGVIRFIVSKPYKFIKRISVLFRF